MAEQEKETKKGLFRQLFATENSLEEQRVRMQEPQNDEEQEQEPTEKPKNYARQVWEFFRPSIIACAILLLLNQFLLLFAVVPTGSMIPAIASHSYILANRCAYLGKAEPQRGDIVVFETDQSSSELLVKRILAVGGDTVQLKEGKVYLNGAVLDESAYVNGETYAYVNFSSTFQVPEGCVLLFGDNRANSADARLWEDPYVPVEDIKGEVFFAVSLNAENRYIRFVKNPFGN